MPCSKKSKDSDDNLPNYSKYDYAETIQTFAEMDRLLETGLNTIECYDEYKLEAPLNNFSDRILNDHLYTMYRRRRLETATLMRKLVGFFVRCYQRKLAVHVKEYLESKKLTLGDWLMSVKDNCHGDILCVYFLSMVTGVHTCIHLKDNKVWSTLRVVPLLYHQLMSRCELHLVSLGFGIFLWLKRRPPIEVNVLPTLGEITNDDPIIITQLVTASIKQEGRLPGTTQQQPPHI